MGIASQIASVIILIAGAATGSALAAYAWRRREVSGGRALALLMAAGSLSAAAEILLQLSQDLSAKIIWLKLSFITSVWIPVFWLVFTLQYTGIQRLVTARRLGLLSIIPLLTITFVFTNDRLSLMWDGYSWLVGGSAIYYYGRWHWVHLTYTYLLILAGIMVFARMLTGSSVLHRRQAAAVIGAGLVPLGIRLLYVTGMMKQDLTPAGFTLMGLFLAVALFRFRMLDIVPIAHEEVIHSLADGILVLDSSCRIIDINPAAQEMLGCTASDTIGRQASEVISIWSTLSDCYCHSGEQHKEVTIGEGKSTRYYDIRMSPLTDERGEVSGEVIILRDITERKSAEEALRHSYEELRRLSTLKDDLTNMIVHDLRTPLTSVLSGLMTLESMGLRDEQEMEILKLAIQGGQTLLDMINDLLDITRMEQGELQLEYADIDPKTIVARAVDQITPLSNEKNLQIIQDVGTDDAKVWADEDKLFRILTNLLGNAVKFTSEGGRITVSVRREDDRMLFSVADSGEGIPEEAFDRIFEKFGQVEDRKSGRKMSTGLGLTFCKMAVEAHGGQIWVTSELGKGSTFYFYIPDRKHASA